MHETTNTYYSFEFFSTLARGEWSEVAQYALALLLVAPRTLPAMPLLSTVIRSATIPSAHHATPSFQSSDWLLSSSIFDIG